MALKGKRVLLTGAGGFVGSHLAEELRRQGAEVLDIDVRGNNPIDLRDWQRLREFGSKLGKVDLVFHLAALMFVPYAFENPREVYEVNVLGTLNLLELCRLQKVDRIVFASSYIYGSPQYLPVDEAHPINPNNPYARSKVMGEAFCRAYNQDCGLKCTILRPFNIYGEGQNDSFLIPSILKQIVGGKVELMDPEPRRDLLYITDAIKAYLKAGEYEGADFEVFNIGLGSSYSVDGIVRSILNIWGRQVEVSYQHERRRNEIMDVVANIQKAAKELGWTPEVELKEGLRRYIKWYKDQLGSSN
jgi:nucleoside-diphosphate-sugar epimerase